MIEVCYIKGKDDIAAQFFIRSVGRRVIFKVYRKI
jgi:hypothetical protein